MNIMPHDEIMARSTLNVVPSGGMSYVMCVWRGEQFLATFNNEEGEFFQIFQPDSETLSYEDVEFIKILVKRSLTV